MSKRRFFAVAAIGGDRPGIVADLSECAYECGCNLEDASMTTLGSEFATLMLVSSAEDYAQQRLTDAFKRLEWERRLTVFLRPLESLPPVIAVDEAAQFALTVEGIDKAGIVAKISRCLADHEVQIADLRSKTTPVPGTGTPVYTLSIRMTLPPALRDDSRPLQRALERVASDLHVELSMESVVR
jgi:glycine cleavage system transcriptional repressor